MQVSTQYIELMTLVPVQVLGRGDDAFTPFHTLRSDLHLLLYNLKFGKLEPGGFVSFLNLVWLSFMLRSIRSSMVKNAKAPRG